MSEVHAGYIHDGGIYTSKMLADIFGVEQARTVHNWLEAMAAPYVRGPNGGRVYSGLHIRLTLERAATCTGKLSECAS